MKNIDNIKNMTIEDLALISAIPFTYMNGYRADTVFRGAFSGCDYDFKKEAIEGELKWLNSEVDFQNEEYIHLNKEDSMLSVCCICGRKIDLDEVCLTEDTGEPICDKCKENYECE